MDSNSFASIVFGISVVISFSFIVHFERKKRNFLDCFKQVKPENVLSHKIGPQETICIIQLRPESAEESERILKRVWENLVSFSRPNSLIGLDVEWRPSQGSERNVRHRVATLQLATRQYAVVIQLLHMKENFFPASMKGILKDRRIIKVGLGIEEDCRRLALDYKLQVSGYVDLHAYGEEIGVNLQGGLSNLAHNILGVSLNKKLQCSNWAHRELTAEQIEYAALDAWVSVELLYHFQVPSHRIYSVCNKLSKNFNTTQWTNSELKSKDGGQSHAKSNRIGLSPSKPSKKYRHIARKTRLYDNCRMLAPDGECLKTCSKKKIDWYVNRGLAEYVNDDYSVIRLFFEPQARSNDEQYYLCDKENRCCVCGVEEQYLRHHIVPHCYRQHFPESMKTHISHDIVLMCVPCHASCSLFDQEKMLELCKLYKAPLSGVGGKKVSKDETLSAVQKQITALIKHGHHMPRERREAALCFLQSFFQVSEDAITLDFLVEQKKKINPWVENPSWISHSFKVVEQIRLQPDGIQNFVHQWREHFVTSMRPRYLPAFWSIENKVIHIKKSRYVLEGRSLDTEELSKAEHSKTVSCAQAAKKLVALNSL